MNNKSNHVYDEGSDVMERTSKTFYNLQQLAKPSTTLFNILRYFENS
jgi:hypothetical protein